MSKPRSSERLGADAARYHAIAEHDGRAYRDYAVEFPPVSLAFIEVINGSTVTDTSQRLAWASLALELATAAALAFGWGRRAAVAYLVLGTLFVALPFVYLRLDLLSVALAMWGMALVRRRRQVLGGGLLALAVFAKFWPLALLPWLIVRREWRALRAAVVTGAVAAAAWIAWSGTAGIEQVVTFRHARGWQVESLVGGLVGFDGAGTRQESGAIRVGDAPMWATLILGIVMVGVVALVWWGASRAKGMSLEDGVAPLTAVAAFLVCSPVLSPQYLLWLLPFAAIAWVQGHRAIALLTGVSAALTMMLVSQYTGNDDVARVLVVARNAVLVALVVTGVALIERARRATRREATSGDLEHAFECDARPAGGALVDGDLVDHLARHQ